MKNLNQVKEFIKELHELFNKHDMNISVCSDFNGQVIEKSTGEWLGTVQGDCELNEKK